MNSVTSRTSWVSGMSIPAIELLVSVVMMGLLGCADVSSVRGPGLAGTCPFGRVSHRKRHNGSVAHSADPRLVVFVVFDGVKLLDAVGPAEVFAEANRFG